MTRKTFVTALGLLLVAGPAAAQQPAVVSGRVTSESGVGLPAATVFIEALQLGTQTGPDGRYSLTVPAARATGQRVTIQARLIGYRAESAEITLAVAFLASPQAAYIQGAILDVDGGATRTL